MKIDVAEQFEHLPRAPIVEAVIDIRARAEMNWEEQLVSEMLKPKLPGYPRVSPQSEFRQEVTFEVGQQPKSEQQARRWKGLRFHSEDGRHIAQFNRDGFVFSRLPPYEKWEHLRDEALRLWRIHADLARPTEVLRIGLRFVNSIVLPPHEVRLEDYLEPNPELPRGLDLPFLGFLHSDMLAVPGYPYAINVVRTGPPQELRSRAIGLILDVDVFTTQPSELREGLLEARLAEMRSQPSHSLR